MEARPREHDGNTEGDIAAKPKPKELWIGSVEVRPLEGCDALEDAKGAFVNIVTWAADTVEFRRNAELVLGKLQLFVVDVDEPEPVEVRRRGGDFEETIEDMISRAQDNPDAIILGTFHLYEKDDA